MNWLKRTTLLSILGLVMGLGLTVALPQPAAQADPRYVSPVYKTYSACVTARRSYSTSWTSPARPCFSSYLYKDVPSSIGWRFTYAKRNS